MDIGVNFDHICRLCLKEKFSLTDIFTGRTPSGDAIYKIVNFIYDLQICPGDGLSTKVCAPCIWRVTEFEVYKKNVHYAKYEMLKIIGLRKNASAKVPSEPVVEINPECMLQINDAEAPGRAKPVCGRTNEIWVKEEVEDEDSSNEMKEEVDIDEWSMPQENYLSRGKAEGSKGFEEDGGAKEGTSMVEDLTDQPSVSGVAVGGDHHVAEDLSQGSSARDIGKNHPGEVTEADVEYDSGDPDGYYDDEEGVDTEEESNEGLKKNVDGAVNVSCGESAKKVPSEKSSKYKEKRFKCSYCDKWFSFRYMMINHMRIHTGEKPHVCQVCGYRTSEKSQLTVHTRVHTGEKPYKCTECEFSTAFRDGLKVHMRRHTGERPYKCTYCDYSSFQSRAIKFHIMTHTGDKPFKCELCDYRGRSRSHVLRHSAVHTGEKPFKCDACDYRSSCKRALKIHFRKHSGEKPYKCAYCDYEASSRSTLNKHLRTHSAEKPFKCQLCNYSTRQKYNLTMHLRTHGKTAEVESAAPVELPATT